MRLLLAVLVAATAVAPAGAGAAVRPALRVVDRAPVTFKGTGFKPLERVRLRVTAGDAVDVRTVRASRTGVFRVAFVDLRFDPCLRAVAAGSKGSRVRFGDLSERICPAA